MDAGRLSSDRGWPGLGRDAVRNARVAGGLLDRAALGQLRIVSIRIEPRPVDALPELVLGDPRARPGEAGRGDQTSSAGLRRRLRTVHVVFVGVEPSNATDPTSRKRRADDFYAKIARDYAEAIAAGSRSPLRDLARAGVPETFLRDAVKRARDRGLLTPAPSRGKAGGDDARPLGKCSPRACPKRTPARPVPSQPARAL